MIRIGIVGCGRILNAHLQGYKRLREAGIDGFRITALCARRVEDARRFIDRGSAPRPPVLAPATGDPLAAPHHYLGDVQDDVDVRVYTDYRELMASGQVDAINDLTPLALHHQVGAAALEAGLHVLTEKPLAISVRAGRLLVERARTLGLTLGVCENIRQMPEVRAAAMAVRAGTIGEVQVALMGGLGGVWSPDRIVADTSWRHRKLLAGGGGSIDIGVHQMHWMRYVVGEIASVGAVTRAFEPRRVRRATDGHPLEHVEADVDDTYLATLIFERAAVGQLWWSWGMHGEPMEVPGGPVLLGSWGSIRGGCIIAGGEPPRPLDDWFEQALGAAERDRCFPLGLRDPFAIQAYDWLRAIERSTDPETSGQEGLRDLACAFAIPESSALGRQVTPDEVLTGRVDTYQREINAHYGLGD